MERAARNWSESGDDKPLLRKVPHADLNPSVH
jgi:hypothetical protein